MVQLTIALAAIAFLFIYAVTGWFVVWIQFDMNGNFWSFQWVDKKSSYVTIRVLVFAFWPLDLIIWFLGNTFFFGPRAIIRDVVDAKQWKAARDIPDSETSVESKGRHYRALPEVKVTKSSARRQRKSRTKNW